MKNPATEFMSILQGSGALVVPASLSSVEIGILAATISIAFMVILYLALRYAVSIWIMNIHSKGNIRSGRKLLPIFPSFSLFSDAWNLIPLKKTLCHFEETDRYESCDNIYAMCRQRCGGARRSGSYLVESLVKTEDVLAPAPPGSPATQSNLLTVTQQGNISQYNHQSLVI